LLDIFVKAAPNYKRLECILARIHSQKNYRPNQIAWHLKMRMASIANALQLHAIAAYWRVLKY